MGIISRNLDRFALGWRLRPYRITGSAENTLARSQFTLPRQQDRLETWFKFISEIDYYARRYDPCTFLTWPPIRNSMVARGALVNAEFDELRRSSRWPEFVPLLAETTVGMPDPFPGMPATSSNLIHQLYHLFQYEQYCGFLDHPRQVFEFGGGYGAMCRLLAGYTGFDQYTIYDLPNLSAFQNYYLTNALPEGLVARVRLVNEIDGDWQAMETDLFVSTWALSEVPLSLRERFEPIIARATNVLLAFQGSIDGVDNVKYFEGLSTTTRHSWRIHEIAHKKNNFYMVGKL